MEKYTVVKVSDSDIATFQKVHVKGKNGLTRDFYFEHVPDLKSGITIKVYKNLNDAVAAYSCKINGKQVVRLQNAPNSAPAFNHFYSALNSADACALDSDICSVLKRRGLKTTWNKENNLRMFVNDMQKVK